MFCAWFEVEFPEGYLSSEGSIVEVAGVVLRFDELLGKDVFGSSSRCEWPVSSMVLKSL